MDSFLADYFGTNQTVPDQATDDLEKMAQLVMLDKIAEDQNIDLSSLSDDEYVALAAEVFNGGQTKVAHQQPSPDQMNEQEKIAHARFEEAKFLGQVVAHSMWNELESIQKHAASPQTEGGTLISGGVGTERAGKTLASGAPGGMESGSKTLAGGLAGRRGEAEKAMKETAKKGIGERLKSLASKGVGAVKAHPGKAALIAGGTLAAAGGAEALRRGLKSRKDDDEGQDKAASAFDTLSDARAYEILQEYGLADEHGNVVTPDQLYGQSEKTAGDELAEAVELDALRKLASLGYQVQIPE